MNLIDPDRFGKPNPSEYAYSLIPFGGTIYGTIQNFKQGNYASGTVGAASTLVSLVFIAFGIYNRLTAQGANGGGLSQQEQLDFAQAEYGQRFSNGSMLASVGRFARDTLGRIWNLPNTVLGTAYGILGIPTKGIGFGYGQLQFKGNLLQWLLSGGGNGAITLGDAGVYPHGFGPETVAPSGFALGFEESFHSLQGRILGPFYLPAHLTLGTSALAVNWDWHGPVNLLEQGPHPPYGSSPTVF